MSNTRRITAPLSIRRCIRHPRAWSWSHSRAYPRRPARRLAALGQSSGGGCAVGGAPLGPPLLAHAPQHALAAVLFETGVQAADLDEHLIGDRLLLLAG